jgi:hypothetical protein
MRQGSGGLCAHVRARVAEICGFPPAASYRLLENALIFSIIRIEV